MACKYEVEIQGRRSCKRDGTECECKVFRDLPIFYVVLTLQNSLNETNCDEVYNSVYRKGRK